MKNILVGLAFLLCSVLLFAGNEDKQVLFSSKRREGMDRSSE